MGAELVTAWQAAGGAWNASSNFSDHSPANAYLVPREEFDALAARVAELEAELERERMRLAACGVAAMSNTDDTVKQRITPDNPYYSASYADVCGAVDREMALRAERDRLREALEKIAERDAWSGGEAMSEQYSIRCAMCGGPARPWWDAGWHDCKCDESGHTIYHYDPATHTGTHYPAPIVVAYKSKEEAPSCLPR